MFQSQVSYYVSILPSLEYNVSETFWNCFERQQHKKQQRLTSAFCLYVARSGILVSAFQGRLHHQHLLCSGGEFPLHPSCILPFNQNSLSWMSGSKIDFSSEQEFLFRLNTSLSVFSSKKEISSSSQSQSSHSKGHVKTS